MSTPSSSQSCRVLGFSLARGPFDNELQMSIPSIKVGALEAAQVAPLLDVASLTELAKDFSFPPNLEIIISS